MNKYKKKSMKYKITLFFVFPLLNINLINNKNQTGGLTISEDVEYMRTNAFTTDNIKMFTLQEKFTCEGNVCSLRP